MSAATVKKLEAELRRRYGRSAVGLLLGLPLDTPSRLRALGRLLGDEAGDPAMRSQCVCSADALHPQGCQGQPGETTDREPEAK